MRFMPAAVRQEPRRNEEDALQAAGDVPAGRGWVRPVALLVLVIAAAVLVALLARYVRLHGAFEAPPGSPQTAGILLAGAVALLALTVIVLRPETGATRQMVLTSVAWAGILAGALFCTWFAIESFNRFDHWHGTPVFNSADVDAYLAQHVPDGVEPILIPTGVLVKSLEFLNGDNVQVTGFIWQKYGPEVPDDFARGVVLAEGVKDPYRETIAYQYEENGVETIGWYFETTLRQPFEYAEYPFDEQNVWLRMWAKDFAQNTILVPDFASYGTMLPLALPGLEREFVYSGWSPIYTGFSLSDQTYGTSFGIGSANEFPGLPELYFDVVLDRDFIGPFFEHVIFAVAVMILLFGLLALTTDNEDLKSRFQLSTAGVLGSASGLLFAVILKHNQLRVAVGSRGMTYMEVIPIILYGVIVVVVLNAILLASPYKLKVVHRRSNLLPVLLYWPVVLGLLFLVTLFVFFHA